MSESTTAEDASWFDGPKNSQPECQAATSLPGVIALGISGSLVLLLLGFTQVYVPMVKQVREAGQRLEAAATELSAEKARVRQLEVAIREAELKVTGLEVASKWQDGGAFSVRACAPKTAPPLPRTRRRARR